MMKLGVDKSGKEWTGVDRRGQEWRSMVYLNPLESAANKLCPSTTNLD